MQHETLYLVRELGQVGDHRMPEMMRFLASSEMTVRRHIATARCLGADIVSYRPVGEKVMFYSLKNWKQIEFLTLQWISLYEKSTLIGEWP